MYPRYMENDIDRFLKKDTNCMGKKGAMEMEGVRINIKIYYTKLAKN